MFRSSSKSEGQEVEPHTIVKLNVGGEKFETTVMTISKFLESYLIKMVIAEEEKIGLGQELFIDRDPKLFRVILQYYREPNSLMLPRKLSKVKALLLEAMFFQLEALEADLNSLIKTYPFAVGDMVKFDPEVIGADWNLSRLHGHQPVVTIQQCSIGPDPGSSECQKWAIATLKGRIEDLNELVARVRFVAVDEGCTRMLRELLTVDEDELEHVDAYILLGALKLVG